MLNNGLQSRLRILGCILVALTGILGAVYLMSQRIAVPTEYWALCMTAVIGVAGAEVARNIAAARRPNGGEK